MQDLVDILQVEHHQLDLLLYRLTVLGLVLESGDLNHLRRATADAQTARQRLRELDLLRATAALDHARTVLSQPAGSAAPTARALAAAAPQPWSGILRDQHEQLATLVSAVEVTGFHAAERARSAIYELARASERGTDPAGAAGAGASTAAGSAGAGECRAVTLPSTWRPGPFDDRTDPDDRDLAPLTAERALQDALQVAGRLRVPSLLAFLQ